MLVSSKFGWSWTLTSTAFRWAHSSSVPELLGYFYQEVLIAGLQKPGLLDLRYSCLAFPAIIRIIEVTHADHSLKTHSFFKIPEERLTYFFLMRQSVADMYNNVV